MNTNYNSERYQREQAVNNAITSLKAANKATREAKEKEITEEYRNAENEAWNAYVIASQTAYIAYAAAYKNAENDYQSAKKNADNEYISTVTVGWNTYNNKVNELDLLFESAIAQAGNENFAPATFFTNGTSGNQGNVLLVKGTKTNDTASDKHWSDSINASKNGVNDWIVAPFKWIGNKISPLLPNFRETDPQEGAERRQELSQRRVTVDKLNNIKSSALNDMNRAVFTEDTIQSDILHAQNIIDGIHNTGYAAKNAIIVGSFLLPGPDDAVWAVVGSKYGIRLAKSGVEHVLTRAGKALKVGTKEFDDAYDIVKQSSLKNLSGQLHHPLSTKIIRELAKNDNISQSFMNNYHKFRTQALDKASHNGYETWHRELDEEIISWLKKYRNATEAEFIKFLKKTYKKTDLAKRFPEFSRDFDNWLNSLK